MALEFAGATDVGRKRDHNEDALLVLPDQNVAVVCDGMGGHEAGEVASGIGVETMKRFFEIVGDPDATCPSDTTGARTRAPICWSSPHSGRISGSARPGIRQSTRRASGGWERRSSAASSATGRPGSAGSATRAVTSTGG